MPRYIMALDQGTTSSRCVLFNGKGEICGMAQKEFHQIFPQPGLVEHDPEEILASQLWAAKTAMERAGATAGDIAAIGITNQRETTIVWDKHTGRPVYNAIVWQCRRTAPRIERLKADGMATAVYEKTGLIPDAYFSATKAEWILDNVPGARERAINGDLLFGTVDSWLIWNLTGGRVHTTDYTNASRTMLYNIYRHCWDGELLRYFNIPESMLPEVRPCSCVYGETAAGIFGGEIPIAGSAGDQQAALFGQCCFDPGEMKNTYGTGCFMLMNTGEKPVRSDCGLITTAAADDGAGFSYALEGSVFVAGAAVQWLRDEMHMIETAPQSEKCCEAAGNTGGVYVVPAFAGMGAPYWNPYARGTVVGLTRGTSRDQFVRATVESMAYQVCDLAEAMEKDTGLTIRELKVDGGASSNDFLMGFQAELLNADIVRPACVETTALGAAYLAGLATGYWSGKDELRLNQKISRRFTNRIDENERETRLRGWRRAVNCALEWAK